MNSIPTIELILARKRVEAKDICSFELVSAQGGLLPAFTAGSHVDVHVGQNIVRQYSLCNSPSEQHRYLLGVLRDPASRGGSEAMHALVEGQTLQISAPKNHFPLDMHAKRHLLLAGGIGVTPILCMAEQLSLAGAEFEVHYCARSRERAAFLERLQATPLDASTRLHFDDGPSEQHLNLQAILSDPDGGTHLYVCGPKGFMDATLSTARAQGWSEAQLHFEYFAGEVVKRDTDAEFEVVLASTGQAIRVAREQTVVQALAMIGIEVPTSCEQGVCGTCLTRVLDGVPDHRDMYLTPQEQKRNDQFLPCCSRARSERLVIDI